MCFSSHTTRSTPSCAVVGERLAPGAPAGPARGSSRAATSSAAGRSSQRGSTAKRLITSSAAVAFSSRTVTVRRSRVVDDALAEHVLEVEQVVVRCCAVGRRRIRGAGTGATGSAYVARGRHRHELPLGPAQRRQRAAEHAAGVDVDRAVEPLGLGHRRVAVDDRRARRGTRPPSCSARAGRTRRSRRWSRRTARTRAPRPSRGPASPPSCPACATTSRPPSST